MCIRDSHPSAVLWVKQSGRGTSGSISSRTGTNPSTEVRIAGIPPSWGPKEFRALSKMLLQMKQLAGNFTFERPLRNDGTSLDTVRFTSSTAFAAGNLIAMRRMLVKLRTHTTLLTFEPVRATYDWPLPPNTKWITVLEGDQSLHKGP